MRAAAQKVTLLNRRSMGRRLAWASSVSPAVVKRAPVMSLATLHWMGANLVMALTEPRCLTPPAGL